VVTVVRRFDACVFAALMGSHARHGWGRCGGRGHRLLRMAWVRSDHGGDDVCVLVGGWVGGITGGWVCSKHRRHRCW
jgi:hypothetical protein